MALQKAPLAGSGIGFCASVSGAVDSAHGSEAQGSAGLAAYKTQARASVMGEKCRLPLVYGCAPTLNPLRTLPWKAQARASVMGKKCCPLLVYGCALIEQFKPAFSNACGEWRA